MTAARKKTPAKPEGKPKRPTAAPPPQRSLSDWISDAEKDLPPDTLSFDFLLCDFLKDPLPLMIVPAIELKATFPTPSQLIIALFKLLWADVEFWMLNSVYRKPYRSGEEPKLGRIVEIWRDVSFTLPDRTHLGWYIRYKYGLLLPEYPPEVWKEMAASKTEHARFIEIISKQEWRWLPEQTTFSHATGELETKKFKDLMKGYFNSRLKMTSLLAGAKFSREVLQEIKSMAQRLAKDADWCLKNDKEIPPDELKQFRGRPTDYIVIQRVEKLADLRRDHPHISDVEAMRLFMKGKEDDAVRKSAMDARELLWIREGIKVGEDKD